MWTSAEQRTYPRRAVLAAGAGLAVVGASGCDLLDGEPDPPTPDPLEPLREQARALAERYDATIAALPALAVRLTPLRDAHLTHVAELTKLIRDGAAAPPSSGARALATPTTARTALADLRAAE